MTNKTQTKSMMIEALVENFEFDRMDYEKLQTIDLVYPKDTANGNSEDFRFSPELRVELGSRANIVRENLAGKNLARTSDERRMHEVAKIAPRLGLEEQLSGEINGIYGVYSPSLVIGQNKGKFVAYVVKQVADADNSMAWFELNSEEQKNLKKILEEKATDDPCKEEKYRKYQAQWDKDMGCPDLLKFVVGVTATIALAVAGSRLMQEYIRPAWKPTTASLASKVIQITGNRDGKPGISFEEQAWMAKELGYDRPIYEGQHVTLTSNGTLYAIEGNNIIKEYDIEDKDLKQFIVEHGLENTTTTSGSAENMTNTP